MSIEMELVLVIALMLVLGFIIYQQSEQSKRTMELLEQNTRAIDRNSKAIEDHAKTALLQHESFQAIVNHVMKMK